MTKMHVIVIGFAVFLAGVALFSNHTPEGLGLASAILTGVFGHAQGSSGAPLFQRRVTPPPIPVDAGGPGPVPTKPIS